MFNMFKTLKGKEIKGGIKLDLESGYSIEIIYMPGYGYSCLVRKDYFIVPDISRNDHSGGLSDSEVCEIIYKVSCLK